MFTLVVAALLVFSNVSLFYVLVNLLKPGQRRIFGLDHTNSKRFGAVKGERHHIAIRARSSLARHSGKAATLKALKKLKGCLCASAPEEQLPLFQIHCTDFRRSMDAARAQVLEQPRRMSKMHSWPPTEQGIVRPMSDLDPVFSMPVLPKILCTVPEEAPTAAAIPLAKGNPCAAAEACAALDNRRQAEELRRVLRSMYKDHFRMQTEVSFESTKGPFATPAYPMTPTAEDLKAELLAHACKLPASGPLVRAGRAASAGAELPASFGAAAREPQQGPQPVLAFPACASCPPEFWGEEKGQELAAQRPAKSMESLLDNLLDMSVAALVSGGSTPRVGATGSAATPELLPVSFRSPFDQPHMYPHVLGARPTGCPLGVMARV